MTTSELVLLNEQITEHEGTFHMIDTSIILKKHTLRWVFSFVVFELSSWRIC